MEVWTLVPQSNFSEKIKWVTDVLRSRNGEQRVCLRPVPRSEITYSFVVRNTEVEAARVLLENAGAEPILLPIWYEATEVAALTTSATITNVVTDDTRYRNGSYAVIVDYLGNFEYKLVTTILSHYIQFDSALSRSYGRCHVAPCVLAYFKGGINISRYNADYSTIEATFETDHGFRAVGSLGSMEELNGHFVMNHRSIVERQLAESHRRETTDFDSVAGAIWKSKVSNYDISTSYLNFELLNWDKEELLKLLLYIKGKLKSFYYPTWNKDFIASTDLTSGDNFILCDTITYTENNYEGFICIVKKDGTLSYHEVANWIPNDDSTSYAILKNTLTETILASEIDLICRMPLMRFNADEIEFKYDASNVKVSIPLIETKAVPKPSTTSLSIATFVREIV